MSRVLVVGDVLLDRDVLGSVERVCPDAPVPVVDQEASVDRAGGAGLAATLAARTGAQVTLLCAIAPDEGGRTLRHLLAADRIEVLDCAAGGSTSEKVRVRAAGQSLLRLDRGTGAALGPVPSEVEDVVGRCDAVLVADYGRGLAAHPEVRALLADLGRRGTPVVWDPHPRGPAPIAEATVVTPNQHESRAFDGRESSPDSGTEGLAGHVDRARRLRAAWGCGAVAVTLGEQGALVVTGDGAPLVVPVEHVVPTGDTCGAGDAFAAALTVSLAGGSVVTEAVHDGVVAAALHVATNTTAEERGVDLRRGTTVATGGCFDVLHAGHVATLEHARRLGDRLVVLLNSDDSVRRLKGPGRPVQTDEDRAAVLSSLSCVDEVVVFGEDTPVEALRRIRPEVFVKGGDYSSTELPETQVLAEWGGTVVTVPFLAGRSTTSILHRIEREELPHVG